MFRFTIVRKMVIPIGRVYSAWTDPETMKLWMFKSCNNKILSVHLDLKTNGKFSIIELSDKGEMIDHFGRYIEIIPNLILSFTLEVPKHFPGVTEIDVIFREHNGGTWFVFSQAGVDPEIVEDNWQLMFNKLENVLAKKYSSV